MGYLKNSAAFQRAMEEQAERDELSYDRYAEELAWNHKKGLGVPIEDDRRSTACKSSPTAPGFPASDLTQEKKH